MGSKERINRHKENIRHNILSAALAIGKAAGWNSLSMRKIADFIEYTPPTIYEYFSSKEALLQELARLGFLKLSEKIDQARNKSDEHQQQLLLMWLAYWDFAFSEQHLYQIMFGIETICCDINEPLTDSQVPAALFTDVIGLLLNQKEDVNETIEKYYYACWSFVHGLISINLIGRHVPQKISEQILTEAISGIIDTLIAPDNNLTKEPYIEEV
jgi:AcrR family transcriptional regulator